MTKAVPQIEYDPISRILSASRPESRRQQTGCVAVCTGGTADIPVAEEVARTAEFFGCRAERIYDVGVAGIHRLLAQRERLAKANCIIAVAGMEGALGTVIAGLVENPVIAVPTSVGYGASFHGLSALLTMINSCANGIAAVNIDNGYEPDIWPPRLTAWRRERRSRESGRRSQTEKTIEGQEKSERNRPWRRKRFYI